MNTNLFSDLLAKHPDANVKDLAFGARRARDRLSRMPSAAETFPLVPRMSQAFTVSTATWGILCDLIDALAEFAGVELPSEKPPAVRRIVVRGRADKYSRPIELEWKNGALDGDEAAKVALMALFERKISDREPLCAHGVEAPPDLTEPLAFCVGCAALLPQIEAVYGDVPPEAFAISGFKPSRAIAEAVA